MTFLRIPWVEPQLARWRARRKTETPMRWIELPAELLDRPEVCGLPAGAQLQLIRLAVLAGRMGGRVPASDPRWLRQALRLGRHDRLRLDRLIGAGLVEVDDGAAAGPRTDDGATTSGPRIDDGATTSGPRIDDGATTSGHEADTHESVRRYADDSLPPHRGGEDRTGQDRGGDGSRAPDPERPAAPTSKLPPPPPIDSGDDPVGALSPDPPDGNGALTEVLLLPEVVADWADLRNRFSGTRAGRQAIANGEERIAEGAAPARVAEVATRALAEGGVAAARDALRLDAFQRRASEADQFSGLRAWYAATSEDAAEDDQ